MRIVSVCATPLLHPGNESQNRFARCSAAITQAVVQIWRRLDPKVCGEFERIVTPAPIDIGDGP